MIPRQQYFILRSIANGDTTALMAERMGLSCLTVRRHTTMLMRRLGATNRAHAVAIAFRQGFLT